MIAEGLDMKPQFFIGRFGLNKEVVKAIRSAFRNFEIVRIELGSPWTDNTTKFAERLELRTGATVLDRAGHVSWTMKHVSEAGVILGCRVLLYRGFTHADLARKGLLDPSCFTVGHEYALRKRRDREDERRFNASKQSDPRTKDRSLTAPARHFTRSHHTSAHTSTNSPHQLNPSDDEMLPDDEALEEESDEEDIIDDASEVGKSTVIDVDGEVDPIVRESAEEVLEESEIADLVARIQVNAARAQESKEFTAAKRQEAEFQQQRQERNSELPSWHMK